MKNNHTNIVGYLILTSALAAIIMFLLNKITLTDVGVFLGIVVTILSSIGFLASADGKNITPKN